MVERPGQPRPSPCCPVPVPHHSLLSLALTHAVPSLSPPGCPGLRVARPCHPQSPGMGVRDVPSPPPRRGLLRGRLGLVHPSFVMGLMYGAGVVPRSVTEGLTWGGSWTCRGCPGRGSDPPHGCLSSPSKVTGAPQTLRGALTLQTIWIQMREDLF